MCLFQPSVSTLPAGYHLSRLTRISQVCKTEPLYLAQESCSISSHHLETKITPGNTCSQHNLARIWNSICAREPLALTDGNAPCGQVAAGWELCFTFVHFPPLFSTVLSRCGRGRQHQQSAHLSTLMKTSGHKNQQYMLGFGKSWCPTKHQLGDWLPNRGKTSLQVHLSLFCHLLAMHQNICLAAKPQLRSRGILLSAQGRITLCPKFLIAQAMTEKKAKSSGDWEAESAGMRKASRESQTSRNCTEGGQEEGARKVMWKHTQQSPWRILERGISAPWQARA